MSNTNTMSTAEKSTVKLPRQFNVTAARTSDALFAEDMNFEVCVQSYINGEIEANGRTLLTGWHWSATTKILFNVRRPVDEESARAGIRQAESELCETMALFRAVEDYMLPIMTGVPLRVRFGQIRRVNRKPSRSAAGYVGDYVADVKDAWAAKLKQRLAQLGNGAAGVA